MDDELRERGVEGVIRERHLLGRPLSNVDAGVPRPRRGNERLGRVDGRHRVGPQPCDELARERARAAADVEDPLASAHRGEVRQLTGQQARVPTHEAVVGLGGDIEAHVPSLRSRSIGWDQALQPSGVAIRRRSVARGALARPEGVGRVGTTANRRIATRRFDATSTRCPAAPRRGMRQQARAVRSTRSKVEVATCVCSRVTASAGCWAAGVSRCERPRATACRRRRPGSQSGPSRPEPAEPCPRRPVPPRLSGGVVTCTRRGVHGWFHIPSDAAPPVVSASALSQRRSPSRHSSQPPRPPVWGSTGRLGPARRQRMRRCRSTRSCRAR